MTHRVERLLAWEKAPDARANRWGYATFITCTAFLAVALKLGSVLALIHSITERFVP